MGSSTKKFRVGFDISALDPTFREHAHRGTGRYVRNIWNYLQNQQSDIVEFVPFTYKELTPPDGTLDRLVGYLPRGKQTVKTQFLYPRSLAKLPVDSLYFPTHFDAPAWCSKPRIISVLDLIPIIMPDLFGDRSKGIRFKFGRWLENSSARNASVLLSISENTARDCTKYLGIDPNKIIVTPLGVDKKFYDLSTPEARDATLKKFAISGNYLITVGGIDPRKNIKTLLPAFKNFVDRERAAGKEPSKLVMVGKIKVDDQYPLLQSLIKELGVSDLVIETGYATDEELIALYNSATALISTTRYEGFGLTPLEAMAAGCPVICSDNSAIPEAVGDAAIMKNAFDVNGFGEGIYELSSNEALRKTLIEKGQKRARQFTWESTGEKTLKGFELSAKRLSGY